MRNLINKKVGVTENQLRTIKEYTKEISDAVTRMEMALNMVKEELLHVDDAKEIISNEQDDVIKMMKYVQKCFKTK
ncbi:MULTISPECIES: hypothetical protein [Bacillus cereus group]|uniref:Uncharacterized protein n=1 Tax=Bacillus thuringiensis TaxID=1428 RepID=A0A9X6WRC4_BACTU|nr:MULTISPECIES: hypothetical protein [Bacillus cereus group]PFJ42763.1 hypothetical protein COJ15_05325 [Bacillus thuringiensis]PGP21075.1 hypothetical protein COA01_16180 [Bacillus cereus]